MKRSIIYIGAVMVFFTLFSCGKFLKESSDDLLIPVDVQHFDALLYGEGYPDRYYYENLSWIKLMTDDIECDALFDGNGWTTDFDVLSAGEGRQAYAWYGNIEERLLDNGYGSIYSKILGCNTVIQGLLEMEQVSEEDKGLYNHVLQAAYTLRAYYYFTLVNLYALPYSKENINELGVILRLTPDLTLEEFERSTIGEVYAQINTDIKMALEYSETATPVSTKALIGKSATQFMAVRAALFQENWEVVITMGEKVMLENRRIYDLNAADKSGFGDDDNEDGFAILNPEFGEVLFMTAKTSVSRGNNYEYLSTSKIWGYGFITSKSSDNALVKSYSSDDLRLQAYYSTDADNYPLKYFVNTDVSRYGFMINWRNVEVLLSLAEAYAQRDGVSEESIEWLNALRVNRIDAATYVPFTTADFASKEALLSEIYAERRRELSYEENIRWWDLRRQGMPELIHYLKDSPSPAVEYKLEAKGKNYVLPIPQSETNYNSVVTQNPRDFDTEQ